ncbi:calcium-dependent secretion activator 2-like [Scylla paramamosain]|uniref:calcium-dependent secretion activator 2-like n=1 Tax=Scylla paramamosain TaxID=85552 RepID=UPI00308326F2
MNEKERSKLKELRVETQSKNEERTQEQARRFSWNIVDMKVFVTDLVRKALQSDTEKSNPFTTKIKEIITLKHLAAGKSYWENAVVQYFWHCEEDSKRPGRMQQPLNSELIMPKEQLFDMFQQILGIKKFEHQLLFNALQLNSQDEQAAAIRRELDGRMQKVAELERQVSKSVKI